MSDRLPRDVERIRRIRIAMSAAGLDILLCALPSNVLLLTGNFPVIGTAIALATREGEIVLLAPEGEQQLAEQSWADDLKSFRASSLEKLSSAMEGVREPLNKVLHKWSSRNLVIGFEGEPSFQPASYAGMHLYNAGIHEFL